LIVKDGTSRIAVEQRLPGLMRVIALSAERGSSGLQMMRCKSYN
jgi:hypothetical protein